MIVPVLNSKKNKKIKKEDKVSRLNVRMCRTPFKKKIHILEILASYVEEEPLAISRLMGIFAKKKFFNSKLAFFGKTLNPC